MEKQHRYSNMLMIAAVLIGLLCSIYMCIQRYAVEERTMTIEQAMDYDAVVSMVRNDGYDTDEALENSGRPALRASPYTTRR